MGKLINKTYMNNPFKTGDKVKYRYGEQDVYQVHTIYSVDTLSLGLKDYPETEQDYIVSIKDIVLA